MSSRLSELLAIMQRLRAADGCPWDREQTFASIAPFTLEEAYEVADAIERGDMLHLKDELGDLLFQVVFHARLAEEAGHFDFEAVAGAICDKLVRRHPHVFAGPAQPGRAAADAAEQSTAWENIKAAERAAAARDRATAKGERPAAAAEHAAATTERAAAAGALDGVPLALPALMRALKLSKRAARVGFDFAHATETADKVAEELAEVRAAAAASAATKGGVPSPEIVEEIGDLLFAAANLARKLGVDPEMALRAANGKFERRFRGMERLAAGRGQPFESLSLEVQEALWQEVKRGE
jgi:MazG family protein